MLAKMDSLIRPVMTLLDQLGMVLGNAYSEKRVVDDLRLTRVGKRLTLSRRRAYRWR